MTFVRLICCVSLLFVSGLLLQGQVRPLVKEGQTRAVVVGVSDYQDDAIGDLRFAHRDAEAFATFLRSPAGGSVSDDYIMLLLNEKATRAQFGKALNWLLAESKAGDKAIIYFSGHGDVSSTISLRGFLLFWDAIPQINWDGGAIAHSDIQEHISTLSVKQGTKVIFISDACRSGKLKHVELGLRGEQRDIQESNEIAILSSQPNEYSLEGQQWGGGRGVFSYYLVNGLYGEADQNKDGIVTVSELRTFIRENVGRDVAPKFQTPEVLGNDRTVLSIVDNNLLALIRENNYKHPESFYPAVPRGFKEARMLEQLDTIDRRIYFGFKEALRDKKFFAPKGACADDYYKLLMANELFSEWQDQFRRDYAAELQDDAQQVINSILKMNVNEINKSYTSRLISYKPQLQNLSRAADILGKDNYNYNKLMSRYHLFYGIIYYLENRHLKTVENGEQVLVHYRLAESYHPINPLIYFYTAECYATQFKNQDSVMHYFNKAIDIDYHWVLPFAYGGHYMSKYFDQPIIAKNYLDQGMKVDPDNQFLLKSLGNWHFYQKQYNEAVSHYKMVIDRDSLDFIIWVNLAACYLQLDDYKLAENAYQKSLAIEPNQSKAYYHLGFLYYNDNRLKEAENAYKRGIQLDPKNTKLKARLIMVYLDQGRYSEAEKECTQISSVNPNDYRCFYYLACISALQEKKNEALILIGKAIQADPEALGAIETSKYLVSLQAMDEFKLLLEKYSIKK